MSDVTGRIGYCGLGTVGTFMTSHLLRTGFEVAIWNRTAVSMARLAALKALTCTSPVEMVPGAQAMVVMRWDDVAVDGVLFRSGGAVNEASVGMVSSI